MKSRRLVFLPLALPLLATTLPAHLDAIQFQPREGLVLTKTFSMTTEVESSMSSERSSSTSTSSSERSLVVTDRVVAHEDERVTKLERTFDEISVETENAELNTSLAAALLTPTRIYVKPILNLVRDFTVKGIVHITGGGFAGNVPRVLPKGVRARIDLKSWPRPPIFDLLQRHAEISDDEMLRVFNCGIGMLVIVPPEEADEIVDRLSALSERIYRIGTIEAKDPDEPSLLFSPRLSVRD